MSDYEPKCRKTLPIIFDDRMPVNNLLPKIVNRVNGNTEDTRNLYAEKETIEGDIEDLQGDVEDLQEGKLDVPTVAGTAGQVLTSDGEGGAVWAEVGAGEIVVDATLTVEGAAADAKEVGVQLTHVKEDINESTGTRRALFTNGYNIALASYSVGDVVSLTPEAVQIYSYAIENCNYGDYVILNCEGGGNPRAYAFLDAQNKLISVASAYKTCSNLVLPVPSGAAKIVINSVTNNLGSCYINVLSPKIANIQTKIEDLEQTKFIFIRGVGIKADGNTGITAAKQYYVHANERKLKYVTSYTNATSFTDVTIDFSVGCTYYYKSMLYKYSGSGNFDGLESISQPLDDISTKTYHIRGVGTKIDGNSGVTGVGQFYVHANERKLKYIKSYTSPTSFVDMTVEFSTDSLYVFNGELYIYSGSDNFDGLLKISGEYYPVTEQVADGYLSQIMNVLDYIGESHFFERKLTIADADAYVSWPIISSCGGKLICAYSRGTSHIDAHSGAYYKTSPNGIIWSSEKTFVSTPVNRENVTGKAFDIDGIALFWVRIGNNFTLYEYEGDNFVPISSNITVGSFAHFGDIMKVANDELLCFWNDYATSRKYGTARSVDGGETWTLTTFPQESSNADVPVETQGAYLGNNKIIAIGRKDISGGTNAQMQFQSSDNGLTWTKAYTNITDIAQSTTSVIYDDTTDELYIYYYNRNNGKLLRRHTLLSDVWGNPTNWSSSETILTDATGADTGNVNVVPLNGKHYIAYYSGNSSKTGVFTFISVPAS